MLHGDGDMYLIYFKHNKDRFCYVVMQNDIADTDPFQCALPKGKYYDWETPYGYGGPLADTPVSEESQDMFRKELEEYCAEQGIVSQFIRFHPLLMNYELMPGVIETRYLRDTVYIDTKSSQIILSNMDSKSRNMVRKAQRNGVTVLKRDISDFEAFIPMYVETMEKNNAAQYYTFQKDYFASLKTMRDNAFILYAMYGNIPISGSIMYYNDRYMHYHLSGTRTEYRKYSPSNLLLYEAACIACGMGIGQFHLGGGMAPDDSLFGFKKQLNKNGRAAFVVGRTIFNRDLYRELLGIRKEQDSDFDIENRFMIQYRG